MKMQCATERLKRNSLKAQPISYLPYDQISQKVKVKNNELESPPLPSSPLCLANV